jgi:hypothetical protein
MNLTDTPLRAAVFHAEAFGGETVALASRRSGRPFESEYSPSFTDFAALSNAT